MGRVLRVIFGFLVACVAAGVSMVLFVYTPAELASDMAGDRLSEATLLALAAGTHSAMFAAPFALIGAAVGEWQRIGSWTYYALVGIAIAALGFFVQYWSEAGSQASIVNSYALTAFIVTGFVAGIAYWLFSGRYAGPNREPLVPEITNPPRAAPTPGPRPSARTAI